MKDSSPSADRAMTEAVRLHLPQVIERLERIGGENYENHAGFLCNYIDFLECIGSLRGVLEKSSDSPSAATPSLDERYWKEKCEWATKLGLCIGALRSLRFQVDESTRERIGALLVKVEQASPSPMGVVSEKISASPQNVHTREQSREETGLLPCPFCGGNAIRRDASYYTVASCPVCKFGWFLLSYWNKRVPLISSREPSLVRRVAPSGEVETFLREYDEGKHSLPPQYALALERSREELLQMVREILRVPGSGACAGLAPSDTPSAKGKNEP